MNQVFVFLPFEIINDVVVIAGEQRDWENTRARIHHQHLVHLNGPWGDFARKATPIVLHANNSKWELRYAGSNGVEDDEMLANQDAKNQPISHCTVDGTTDFDQLRQVARNIYESIEFYNALTIPTDFSDMLGDRLVALSWAHFQGLQRTTAVIEFLKRQLRSKQLRRFSVNSINLREAQFLDLLVDFVKKPTFELLDCWYWNYIPAEVFIAADRAWRATRSFATGYQKIRGLITDEAANELKKYFRIREDLWQHTHAVHHSVHRSAKKTINLEWKKEYNFNFTLEFSNYE